eukprot:403331863
MKKSHLTGKPIFGLSYEISHKPIRVVESKCSSRNEGFDSQLFMDKRINERYFDSNTNQSIDQDAVRIKSNLSQAYRSNKLRTERLTKPTTSSLNHRVKSLNHNLLNLNITLQKPQTQQTTKREIHGHGFAYLNNQRAQQENLETINLNENSLENPKILTNTCSHLNLRVLNDQVNKARGSYNLSGGSFDSSQRLQSGNSQQSFESRRNINKYLKDKTDFQNQRSKSNNYALPNSLLFQAESTKRQWLDKHGKSNFVVFTSEELQKLRKYFKELDTDGSGSIGLEELEQPLISLGLCKTREEVQHIMDSVDEDKSGQIEFDEFLTIIKGAQGKLSLKEQKQEKDRSHTATLDNQQFKKTLDRENISAQSQRDIRIVTRITRKNTLPPLAKNKTTRVNQLNKENSQILEQPSVVNSIRSRDPYQKVKKSIEVQNVDEGQDQKIFNFFKNLTSGNLKSQENPNIPFQLFLSGYRRKRILDAVMKNSENINNSNTKSVLKIYHDFIQNVEQDENISVSNHFDQHSQSSDNYKSGGPSSHNQRNNVNIQSSLNQFDSNAFVTKTSDLEFHQEQKATHNRYNLKQQQNNNDFDDFNSIGYNYDQSIVEADTLLKDARVLQEFNPDIFSQILNQQH